jgi:hypothetical protein
MLRRPPMSAGTPMMMCTPELREAEGDELGYGSSCETVDCLPDLFFSIAWRIGSSIGDITVVSF